MWMQTQFLKCPATATSLYSEGETVVVEKNGTFTMTGGTIRKGSAGSLGTVTLNGTFNMTGGTISENAAVSGGGVYVDVNGNFVMSDDAIITANRASYGGGGVYLKKPADTDPEYTGGTFTMNGGTISNNTVSSYNFGYASLGNGDGGGVWVGDTTTFNMTGGTITGNKTTYLMYADDADYNDRDWHMGLGGGVYVRPNGIFNVSGAPLIQGNQIGNKPETLLPYVENNVFLEDTAKITVAGELNGAQIGISPQYRVTRPSQYTTENLVEEQTVSAGYTDKMGELPPFAASFFCDADGFAVIRKNNEAVLWRHTHTFAYSVNDAGDTLRVGCTDPNCDYNTTLVISAADADYTGEAVSADLSDARLFNLLTDANVSAADIEYYQVGTKLDSAPSEIGTYTAKFTYSGYTIEKTFSIKAPVHDHAWRFEGFTWSGDNESGFSASANYKCTYTGCGATESIDAVIDPEALPAAKCVEDQTVTVTASVSAADSLDGTAHSDAKETTIAAIGSHDWSSWTAQGEGHFRTCKRDGCGEVESESHTWDGGKLTAQATCKVAAETTFTCTVCGATKTETGALDPDNHADYGTKVVNAKAATCKEDGYTGDTVCNGCGKVLEEGRVIAKETVDHTWNTGAITTPATCKEAGVKTFICSVCGAERTEPVAIDPANHADYGTRTEGAFAATCEKDGYTGDVYCLGCGKQISAGTATAAIGHKWNNGVVTKDPTCTETGLKTCTCLNDASHTKTEEIAALGHDWGAWEVTKEATDTEPGEKQRTCSRCGEVETAEIPIGGEKDGFRCGFCDKCEEWRDLPYMGLIVRLVHYFVHLGQWISYIT